MSGFMLPWPMCSLQGLHIYCRCLWLPIVNSCSGLISFSRRLATDASTDTKAHRALNIAALEFTVELHFLVTVLALALVVKSCLMTSSFKA